MKQLFDPKFCLGCKDPCCEFSRKYLDLAPVFTDEEQEKIVAKGVPKEFFKKNGNSWQVVLVDNGGVYLDCPLVKIYTASEKSIQPSILNKNISAEKSAPRLYNKKTCGVQDIKPLMCRLFPFAVLGKKICASGAPPLRRGRTSNTSRAHMKIFLGVYQKGSACYALEKVDKKKMDKHIEYLKKYLKGMKEIFKKYPELVERAQSDIKIICEV